jgi:uncharacterized Zn ribbon protein
VGTFTLPIGRLCRFDTNRVALHYIGIDDVDVVVFVVFSMNNMLLQEYRRELWAYVHAIYNRLQFDTRDRSRVYEYHDEQTFHCQDCDRYFHKDAEFLSTGHCCLQKLDRQRAELALERANQEKNESACLEKLRANSYLNINGGRYLYHDEKTFYCSLCDMNISKGEGHRSHICEGMRPDIYR